MNYRRGWRARIASGTTGTSPVLRADRRSNITIPEMSALGQKRTSQHLQPMSALPPCVDGSELARTFFTFAALVGAAMCSAFQCGTQAAGHNALRGSGPNQ